MWLILHHSSPPVLDMWELFIMSVFRGAGESGIRSKGFDYDSEEEGERGGGFGAIEGSGWITWEIVRNENSWATS